MTPGGYRTRLAMMVFAIAGMNIGYTAILPFLPQIQSQLHLTPVLLGVFLLGYPATKIVTQALIGGRVTDRFGPPAAGATAWLTGAAGMLLIALSETAGGAALAITGRLVWGIGTGLGIPAIYRSAGMIAAHYNVPVARIRATIGAGAVLTLALGPAIAALVHLFAGYSAVLLFGAALSMLGAASSYRAIRLPATEPAAQPAAVAAAADEPPSYSWLLPLILFGCMELILNLLLSATEPLIPLFLSKHSHDATTRSAFILTAGLGVWVVVTLASGHGPEWLRRPGSGVGSLLLLAAACLGLTGLNYLALAFAAIAVFMVAQGQGYLVARTGIDVYTSASGSVWGQFNAIGDVGYLAGPVVATVAYADAGKAAFTVLAAGTLAAAVGYGLLCTLLLRLSAAAPAVAEPPDSHSEREASVST